jgi:hypothetical protein
MAPVRRLRPGRATMIRMASKHTAASAAVPNAFSG